MNKKIFVSFICFWFGFLISCALFPNTVLFKQIQAVYQDKVLVSHLNISIIDEIKPTSEIISLNKLDQQTVRLDYQASDIGAGIDYVQLWQRSLNNGWELTKVSSSTTGYFTVYFLSDNVYQWQTIAVDKAGNKQSEAPELLAQEEFRNWQFSTIQIDTRPPSIAFSIPDFIPTITIADNFEINGQGENQINADLIQNDSYLVFEYRLVTQATAEEVFFQTLIDDQLVYTDGSGEKGGWVGDGGWRQVTYPLKNRQGAIEILFRLINFDQVNYIPNLKIRNIGIINDKVQFDGYKIKFTAHDLGSGIKEKTMDDDITVDELESKLFTATDFVLNTTTFEPNF